MINCDETRQFLQAYVDGEIDGEDRVLLAAHLESCESCQQLVRFERLFRQRLRESAAADPVKAPPWLRQKVRQALKEADPAEESRPVAWLKVLIPSAVAAILVIGVFVSKQIRPTPTQTAGLADQTINWHRRHLPMDVTGPSPDSVRRYFSDKVSFAVHPPVFRQPGTQLVGARLANLYQHQAAYVVYRVGNRRVSVFIFDPDAVRPEGDPMQVGGRKVLWRNRRGYNVVFYNSGGTGYMVASDLDREQLVRLIAHSR